MKWLPQQPVTVKGDPASRAFLEYLNGLGGPTAPAWGSVTGTLSDQLDLQAALDAKQDDLVSGTNIKTVNGNSLLGSGDLVISGGSTLLATVATTSGTSQSATSLVLTPYKFLLCVVNGVSFNVSDNLRIAGQQTSPASGSAAGVLYGHITVDLTSGLFWSTVSVVGPVTNSYVGLTGYSTATTTVTFAPAGAQFDAGSIRVYGVT